MIVRQILGVLKSPKYSKMFLLNAVTMIRVMPPITKAMQGLLNKKVGFVIL